MNNWLSACTSLFTGVVGWSLNEFKNRKDIAKNAFGLLIADIESVRETSTEYWSRTVKAGKRTPIDLSQEGTLRGKNHLINKSLISLSRYIDPKIYVDVHSRLTDLRKLTTGDTLGQANEDVRDANPEKIGYIQSQCSDLVVILRQCSERAKIFSRY